MGYAFLLPLRILQLVTASAVLGLSSYGMPPFPANPRFDDPEFGAVAHWYDADTLTASPSQFNFLIFTGVWTLLSIFYLEIVPRRWPRGSHPYAAFALESLTTLFHFSGFIALSVFLSKLLFCRGTVCTAARIDVGVATFGFVLWLASTVVVAVEIFKGGFRGVRGGKTEMRGVPSNA
ncbi:hypothetical protein V502_09462 [Pseudogymnoascus sp. VKM F-4520 (FW-2644)]|nr:hypothetical protein V502_09462 [Pseudogymnoascus sp. VKM F-4520 (FW-2644)]